MFTEAPVSVSVTTTHYYKSEMEVYQLANIKSAKKRILVNRTKAAQAALTEAISTISKATSKGVYHKNNCARKISRLSKAVNSIG